MRVRRDPRVLRLVVLATGLSILVLAAYFSAHLVGRLGGAAEPSWQAWLAATGAVAVAVPLLRPRLDRLADRLAYGRDGDQYAVMNRFVRRMSDALAVDDVLPHLARTATRALHSPHAEVRMYLSDGDEWRQTWPPEDKLAGDQVSVGLKHAGSEVGLLGVEVETTDLSPLDRELLHRLAGPAGLALSNVRLTFDLRRRLAQTTDLAEQLLASRQRLLEAAAGQRRRLTAEVEEQVLVRLAAADTALDRVAAGDRTCLADADQQIRTALEALRDLAAGLFPPALVDSGLTTALRMYLARSDTAAYLRDGADGRFSPPVETAVYFSAVALVEDAVRQGGSVGELVLQANNGEVRLEVYASVAPTPEVAALVTDRAEAVEGYFQLEPTEIVRVPGHRRS